VQIIHLKRFGNNIVMPAPVGGAGGPPVALSTKRSTPVLFPAVLTLRLDADPIAYSLIGVIVHIGDAFLHGHYVAVVKNAATGEWRKMDDRVVSPPLSIEQVLQEQAYVLFYIRMVDSAASVPPQFVLPPLPSPPAPIPAPAEQNEVIEPPKKIPRHHSSDSPATGVPNLNTLLDLTS
jgi:hypothetical protein